MARMYRKKTEYRYFTYGKAITLLFMIIVIIFAISLTTVHKDVVEKTIYKTLKSIYSNNELWQKNLPQKKILASVDKLAWPFGTEKEKWLYGYGDFKYEGSRDIYKELGYEKTDADCDYTACNHFVDVVVYDALGVKIHIMPNDARENWEELPEEFEIVHEGSLDGFELQPGDIVRYKKNKADGRRSQHSFIYYGGDKLAESGIRIRYPVIRSIWLDSGKLKWKTQEVDTPTIQVIRIRSS